MEQLYERRGTEAVTVSEDATNIVGETSNVANTHSGDETIQTMENRKRKEREESSSEPLDDGEDESNVPKRKRFIWTSEMHQKFVDAIAQLGEDRAFPKKIVEVMNEPGLTREIVASHLQKYRISLKKSQEERDWYSSLGTYQQRYLGTSQLASNNYLPISSSIHSSLYGIRTGIGASSTTVRLAPPSYSCFDVSSLPAVNTGNMYNQHSRRTEANTSFRNYGHEEGNLLVRTFKERQFSSNSDHATSSGTSNSAFTGLRIATDGKSLLFGGSNRSEIVSTGSYQTQRNDFHQQESEAPQFPSFNMETYAQDSPLLPPLPDFDDHMKEPHLPPLPEFIIENSLLGLETEENEFINLIPQDLNSISSGHTSTSFDYQNSLQSLASEILENIEREQNAQILSNNHTATTSSGNTNTNMAFNLINEEASLPPLPSEVPWNLYPDTTTSTSVLQFMDQHNSPLPPLPSESEWTVNPGTSTMPVSFRDHESLLPSLPAEISWNLDSDQVLETCII